MKKSARVPRGLVMAVVVTFCVFVVLSVMSGGLKPATAQEAQPTPAPLLSVALNRELAGGGDLNENGVVDPGDTLRYTVTVTNDSAQASGPVEVVVKLDNTLVGAVTNITDGGAQGEGGEVVWPFDDIPGGEAVTLGFDATLRGRFPSGRSQLTSTALVRSPDGAELARGSTLPLEVVGPILKLDDVRTEIVTDANDSGSLDAGDTLRLIITYSNAGAGPSQDATIVSDYPEELVAQIIDNPNDGLDDGSTMGWTVGPVPADGETHEVRYDIQLQSEFPAGVVKLPFSTEIRSGGVVRDTSELEIAISGASLTVETDVSFVVDQDADRLGDSGDELQFEITFANIGNESTTDVTVSVSFNTRFLEALDASDGGRIDAEAGVVTWNVPEIGAGQRATLALRARILAVPEGLAVINTNVRLEGPGIQTAETQRAIQLDTGGAEEPGVVPTPSIIEQRPAQGQGVLQPFTVGVLLAAFLFLSLLSIGYVSSRVLSGPPPDTDDERAARRRLVRELIEGVILALILFTVMVLGLQNALDQDSVNSIIAGIVGYVAGRVSSQR